MEIKICGIRRIEDIEIVNRCKPDYIGFILSKGFGRTVSVQLAGELRNVLADGIKTVGVFVNDAPEYVRQCAMILRLDAVQLHGDEDTEYMKSLNVDCEIWKAVRVRGGMDITDIDGADKILIDKYDPKRIGGTGEAFGKDEIGKIMTKTPIILAGGLNAETVCKRINIFKPQCVDVSSSVETDGYKDEKKIEEFINKVRMI